MKTYLDCIPCFMKQALRVGKISTDDEKQVKKILDKAGQLIHDIPMACSPPEIAKIIYDEIKSLTGVTDPYKTIKHENIKKARALLPRMREIIESSDNPLFEGARMAIAGNVIDFGIYETVNIEREILYSVERDLTINDFDLFVKKLAQARNIFYIGDNSAEAVFDRLFIEQINKPVTFVVRGEPILNDITRAEAEIVGLNTVADIMSSGTSAPGNVINDCAPEFLNKLADADLVISKGQGNYEALSDTSYPIFFMLKAKCHVIARDIGVPEGSLLLMARQDQQTI
ncbi:MAG: damage-control phosphatase ARMT1 family protein [Fidelibacterota bacterium]